MLRRILENIQHLKQKIESLFIMAQKQSPFQAQKYGNFCQVTLKIQKILASSNQTLNLGSLKTVHAVCAGYISQT